MTTTRYNDITLTPGVDIPELDIVARKELDSLVEKLLKHVESAQWKKLKALLEENKDE